MFSCMHYCNFEDVVGDMVSGARISEKMRNVIFHRLLLTNGIVSLMFT